MTPQEAHEYMENEIRCIQRSKICDRNCAKCELVKEDKALIEAYGMAIIALEKQTPKTGKFEYNSWTDDPPHFICPCCQNYMAGEGSSLYKYCYNCGQALNWGDTE